MMNNIDSRSSFFTITLQEIINEGGIVFDFEYDLFPLVDKAKLENDFIEHFYFREICYETFSMWKNRFKYEWKAKLKLYNVKFELGLRLKELDPIVDYNIEELEAIKRVLASDEDSSATSSSQLIGDDKVTVKDTPLSEYDDTGFVSGITTNKTDQQAESTQAGLKSISDTEDTDTTKTLIKKGSYKKIIEYGELLKDYTVEFIDSFEKMFMGIF